MESSCQREIVELHRFFQDWFNAVLEEDDESFARFEDVMADSFALVSPDGAMAERPELAQRLRQAHGCWADGPPSRIWIEDVQLRLLEDPLALFTYRECQDIQGNTNRRLSSVLFRRRPGTPNGVEWLHVHEVGLPAD